MSTTDTLLKNVTKAIRKIQDHKTCSKCGVTKPHSDFGFRLFRGKRYLQSWCNECRSTTSTSYTRPPRK